MTDEHEQIELWDLDGMILLFIGAFGTGGVLRCQPGGDWDVYPYGSTHWNSFHQRVYRNFKADRLSFEDLKARGVKLPDLKQYEEKLQAKPWESNFCSDVSLSDAPEAIRSAFTSGGHEPLKVYLVLFEDTYETQYGDGCFVYPHAAFWTKSAADEEVVRQSKTHEWYAYSVKEILMHVDESKNRLIADLNIVMDARYSIYDLFSLLPPKQ